MLLMYTCFASLPESSPTFQHIMCDQIAGWESIPRFQSMSLGMRLICNKYVYLTLQQSSDAAVTLTEQAEGTQDGRKTAVVCLSSLGRREGGREGERERGREEGIWPVICKEIKNLFPFSLVQDTSIHISPRSELFLRRTSLK